MPTEIQQPNIDRPFFGSQMKEPFNFYYRGGLLRIAWIRHVAPQLKIDASKYILGEIIGNLEGDDNLFSLGEKVWRDKPEANIARNQLMGRIQWKLEAPETPNEIIERLTLVKEKLANLDWSGKENHELAKKTWNEIKQWVTKERKLRPDWDEAVKYSFEADGVGPEGLSYHYQIFLHGSPPPEV